jgi:hypothetical protein
MAPGCTYVDFNVDAEIRKVQARLDAMQEHRIEDSEIRSGAGKSQYLRRRSMSMSTAGPSSGTRGPDAAIIYFRTR